MAAAKIDRQVRLETHQAMFDYLAARFVDGEPFKLQDLRDVAAPPLARGLDLPIPGVREAALWYAHNMLRKQRKKERALKHPVFPCNYTMIQEPLY